MPVGFLGEIRDSPPGVASAERAEEGHAVVWGWTQDSEGGG